MPLSSAPEECSRDYSGCEDEEYPKDDVAPPLWAAAVGIDVDVRHAYVTGAG